MVNTNSIIALGALAAAGVAAASVFGSNGESNSQPLAFILPEQGQQQGNVQQGNVQQQVHEAATAITPDPEDNPLTSEPTSDTETIMTDVGEETAALPQQPTNLGDANTVTDPDTGTQVSVDDTINTEFGEETAALPQNFDLDQDNFEDDDATDFETSGGDTINDFGGASVL